MFGKRCSVFGHLFGCQNGSIFERPSDFERVRVVLVAVCVRALHVWVLFQISFAGSEFGLMLFVFVFWASCMSLGLFDVSFGPWLRIDLQYKLCMV